jgi:hypothetical protein
MTSTVRPSCPGISGARPYPHLVDPSSATSRPGLDRHRTTKGPCSYDDHRKPHVLNSIRDVSSSYHQQSPRHPGDGRPSPEHVATATSTAPAESSPLRHRLRVSLGLHLPYKREGRGLFRGEETMTTDDEDRRFSSTSEINISSNTPFYLFLETWDRLPLSQLVTPTQALRCKEIQHLSPPLDVGSSLPEPG